MSLPSSGLSSPFLDVEVELWTPRAVPPRVAEAPPAAINETDEVDQALARQAEQSWEALSSSDGADFVGELSRSIGDFEDSERPAWEGEQENPAADEASEPEAEEPEAEEPEAEEPEAEETETEESEASEPEAEEPEAEESEAEEPEAEESEAEEPEAEELGQTRAFELERSRELPEAEVDTEADPAAEGDFEGEKGDAAATSNVRVLLDTPRNRGELFELIPSKGKPTRLDIDAAKEVVPGEYWLTFDQLNPKLRYTLKHFRADAAERTSSGVDRRSTLTLFKDQAPKELAQVTDRGARLPEGLYRLKVQVPEELPRSDGNGTAKMDEVLVARSPVLVHLQVKDV